jgi:hypothetical protein
VFKDRLRTMLGNPSSSDVAGRRDQPAERVGHPAAVSSSSKEPPLRRQSPGLDQFISSIKEEESVSVLDLAGASQANISFITDLGHRVFSDDIVHALDSAFGDGDFFANQTDPERVRRFMAQTLDFADNHFGGALVWDTLQFLAPQLLQQTVDQLHSVLQPGACMLAFFNADEKQTTIPSYSYRIADAKSITLTPKGIRRRAQFFNNRGLERLFANFSSVKFFLTRDHLREVIVKR